MHFFFQKIKQKEDDIEAGGIKMICELLKPSTSLTSLNLESKHNQRNI